MNVEIVTIGDELLLGFTIDTNAAFLARALGELGVRIVRRTTCGDDAVEIAAAVRDGLDRAGAVITTGGLGPTADDLTKPAIAALFGRALHRDEDVVARLEAIWRERRRPGPVPPANLQQAMIPDGARILRNDHGTAPGIFLGDEHGRWVAMLPGVPREMREMFTHALAPLVVEQASGEGAAHVVRSRTLRTTGVAESVLAGRLAELGRGFDGVSLAFLPGTPGVDLRLTVHGVPATDADRRLGAAAARVRALLGAELYGEGSDDLAAVVLAHCRGERLRLAVAESCTGGLLGARLTAVPGASDVFHGGIIAYDNRVKRQLLGVLDTDLSGHGAVSEAVARQMARGIRIRLGTEIGIAITGVAGPGGGTPEKPVGTVWVAIDVAEGRPPIPRPPGRPPLEPYGEARVFQLVGDRDEIRQRAAQGALELVRRTITQALSGAPDPS